MSSGRSAQGARSEGGERLRNVTGQYGNDAHPGCAERRIERVDRPLGNAGEQHVDAEFEHPRGIGVHVAVFVLEEHRLEAPKGLNPLAKQIRHVFVVYDRDRIVDHERVEVVEVDYVRMRPIARIQEIDVVPGVDRQGIDMVEHRLRVATPDSRFRRIRSELSASGSGIFSSRNGG